MSTFEISCCFSGRNPQGSTLDAQQVADTVIPLLPVDPYDYNGGRLFALQTTDVFFGTRRAHTNVHVTLRDTDFAKAKEVQVALTKATGVRWNAPTQDPDEVEKELAGGKSWGMFTSDGAKAVQALVDGLERDLRSGDLSPIKLSGELEKREVEAARHPGYGDTAVREEVWGRLDKVLDDLGLVRRGPAW